MRPALRLLAAVKNARYLEAGNPTGLTGLFTHPAPRSTLLYLYSSTLNKLQALPEHSVYRQSVEALTNHRFRIVERIKPGGYEEWAKRAAELVEKNPKIFNMPDGSPQKVSVHGGSMFVTGQIRAEEDETEEEWDGEEVATPTLKRLRRSSEGRHQGLLAQKDPNNDAETVTWELEPPLEAAQVNEMENQIGAGLIEEVIQVAEGELKLIETMLESKVWEELEEKPPQGQWDYFTRDQHTPGTQEPPNK